MTFNSKYGVRATVKFLYPVSDRTTEYFSASQCHSKILPLTCPLDFISVEGDFERDVDWFSEIRQFRFACIETNVPIKTILAADVQESLCGKRTPLTRDIEKDQKMQ